jgi:Galactose oxidase, central domain
MEIRSRTHGPARAAGTPMRLGLVVFLVALAGASPLAAQGTFSRTGDATIGRNLSVATLLADGRVLVTGGTHTGAAGSVFNREAEIFDPATRMFTATGSMSVPRIGHAAIRLNDGRVLVLGGQQDATTSLASAEIFDPATGMFTSAGNMNAPRQSPVVALLKDGRVLIVGGTFRQGQDTFIVLAAEIFDPATGKFTLSGRVQIARVNQAAVALPDGRVLILAGVAESSLGPGVVYPKEAEAFDPAAGTFSTIGQISEGRDNPTATLLPNGKVLIAGGSANDAQNQPIISNTVEVFDPASGVSSTPTAMSEGRLFHVAQALADGRVLLAGGTTGANLDHSTASADLFDPATGTITPTGAMTESRTGASAVRLLDGSILVVGGARREGGKIVARLQTAETFKP